MVYCISIYIYLWQYIDMDNNRYIHIYIIDIYIYKRVFHAFSWFSLFLSPNRPNPSVNLGSSANFWGICTRCVWRGALRPWIKTPEALWRCDVARISHFSYPLVRNKIDTFDGSEIWQPDWNWKFISPFARLYTSQAVLNSFPSAVGKDDHTMIWWGMAWKTMTRIYIYTYIHIKTVKIISLTSHPWISLQS